MTWVRGLKYRAVNGFHRVLSWMWFELLVVLMAFQKRYERPDVFIGSSLSLFTVLSGCFYKKVFKTKFIFEVRDIWPQSLIDLKGVSKNHPLVYVLGKLELLGYRYADAIVGSMPGLREHVEQKVGLGIKVHYLPQPVSLEFFETEQKEVTEEYISKYIPKGKFIIMYAGSMGPANALEFIIDAARVAQKTLPEVCFVLVGDGHSKQELAENAKGLDNVIFAPRVRKSEVQSVLVYADVLVASFRQEDIYRYGMSLNKFVDYMYAAKPVVAMYSGFPSMINEAGCGTFSPAEKSDEFVQTLGTYFSMACEERNAIGRKGREFLMNVQNSEVLSTQFESLFHEADA
ncbi:MAG: glycosyltransferase family 4 protein [Oleiphilaceae bacterium]|nr:glycosyltransferase family 4 protein [Oleiphilaceae bacterium]